jgi:hypothetical protein
MIVATVNEPVVLSLAVSDGRTDLYPKANIYNSAGSLVASVDIDPVSEGLYSVLYTPTTEGFFNIVYEVFFDIGRTVSAGYEKQAELLDCNSTKTNILRLLGLAHYNSIVDSTTYDTDGNLTSARIRCYDSAINALAAGAPGLLFQYDMVSTYLGGQMSTYSLRKVL